MAGQHVGFYVQQGASTAVIGSSGEMEVKSGGKISVESGGVVNIESGGAFQIAGTAFVSSDGSIRQPYEVLTSSDTLSSSVPITYISSGGQSTTATYVLPVLSSGMTKQIIIGNGGGTTGAVVLRTAATSASFDGTNNIATFTTNGNTTIDLWALSTNRLIVNYYNSSSGFGGITFSAGA